MLDCPDPIHDPEGYALWRELRACSSCHGDGCGSCDWSGVDVELDPATPDE